MHNNNVIELPQNNLMLPVTRYDVARLKEQRQILKEFILSQMREANFKDKDSLDYGIGDYGVIPGTKKKSLLKPGAEKLQKLFNLGFKVRLSDKIIERGEANFASFTYCAIIHPLFRENIIISECEGNANSGENKFKERNVWEKKKLPNGKEISESKKEPTPVCDLLNTLMRMAQKRAIIGATIAAVGASDYFTQDLEPDYNKAINGASLGKDNQQDSQSSQSETNGESSPPSCCGTNMMISKYADRETGEFPYYCTKCKRKEPSGIKV